jgi:hypothetical protein
MLARARIVACAVAISAATLTGGAWQKPDSRLEENERSRRAEGQAIIAIADAAMNGDQTPSDIAIQWRNDFFKAQQGLRAVRRDHRHGHATRAFVAALRTTRAARANGRRNSERNARQACGRAACADAKRGRESGICS